MSKAKIASARTRTNDSRTTVPNRKAHTAQYQESPAAGAHAAAHLTNEDATPGAGALPSHAHRSGKDVDGGAG